MWNISSQNWEDIVSLRLGIGLPKHFEPQPQRGPSNVRHFFTTKPSRRNFDNFCWNTLIAACVFSLEKDIFDKNINFDGKCDRKNENTYVHRETMDSTQKTLSITIRGCSSVHTYSSHLLAHTDGPSSVWVPNVDTQPHGHGMYNMA